MNISPQGSFPVKISSCSFVTSWSIYILSLLKISSSLVGLILSIHWHIPNLYISGWYISSPNVSPELQKQTARWYLDISSCMPKRYAKLNMSKTAWLSFQNLFHIQSPISVNSNPLCPVAWAKVLKSSLATVFLSYPIPCSSRNSVSKPQNTAKIQPCLTTYTSTAWSKPPCLSSGPSQSLLSCFLPHPLPSWRLFSAPRAFLLKPTSGPAIPWLVASCGSHLSEPGPKCLSWLTRPCTIWSPDLSELLLLPCRLSPLESRGSLLLLRHSRRASAWAVLRLFIRCHLPSWPSRSPYLKLHTSPILLTSLLWFLFLPECITM